MVLLPLTCHVSAKSHVDVSTRAVGEGSRQRMREVERLGAEASNTEIARRNRRQQSVPIRPCAHSFFHGAAARSLLQPIGRERQDTRYE
jgi:hypothetical protein